MAASDRGLSAPQIIKLYSKRWTIEPSFRDSKDWRFGMGMSALRIDDPQRRDRLLLLNAFAILLLTLWLPRSWNGPAIENKHRQASRPFPVPARLPALRPHPQHAGRELRPLVERYQELLRQSPAFSGAFGLI